jgi:hypothetical protein
LQLNFAASAGNRYGCDVSGAGARGVENLVQRFMVCIQRLVEKKTIV